MDPEHAMRSQSMKIQSLTTSAGPPVATDPRWQQVRIDRVANGFTVVIGCKIFVAKTWAEAAGGLGEYWENPIQAGKKYLNNSV